MYCRPFFELPQYGSFHTTTAQLATRRGSRRQNSLSHGEATQRRPAGQEAGRTPATDCVMSTGRKHQLGTP